MRNDLFKNKGNRDSPVFPLLLILFLEAITAFLIHNAAISDNIFTHLQYLPIILTAILFDFKVTILSCIIAELFIEVFSLPDIGLSNPDRIQLCVFRLILFIIIGLTVNFIKNFDLLQLHRKKNNRYQFSSELPGWDHFNQTTQSIIQDKNFAQFQLLLIEISNQNDLLSTFPINKIRQINQEVISRIRSVYDTDKLFYIRLNTFCLLLTDVQQNIQRLVDLLEEPILVNGIPVHCEITIGETSYPENGYNTEVLLRNCFLALNEAKRHQKPYHQSNAKIFNPETPIMLGQFQVAMEKKQIDFYYQPIIHINGQVCALEALVRWKHPIKGIIPPNEFIQDLEFTRIINHLTYYSLETNLARMNQIYEKGFDIDITLNISITNLFQPDFADKVIAACKKHSFPGHHLILEITERGFLSNDPGSQKNLSDLLHYGVQISMDDFGAGSTSISNFRKKGITSIKIDSSFIRDIHNHKSNQAILKGLVSIAKSANIFTIAEGVEEVQEKEKVIDLGFDCLQGYLISKPLDFDAIQEWLKQAM